MSGKKLTKSDNKMLFGVCSGIADYIAVDPTLVRLAFALITFAWGAGALLYIAGAILMPAAPLPNPEDPEDQPNLAEEETTDSNKED